MGLLGACWNGVLAPVVESALGGLIEDEAGKVFAGAKQEVLDRLAGWRGRPGNHDIERAVRVAQLQALSLVVRAYARVVAGMPAHEGLVDENEDPADFLARANRFLNEAFRRRVIVELDKTFFEIVLGRVGGDLRGGAFGQVQHDPSETDRQAVAAVVEELRRRTGRDCLPRRFMKILHEGEGSCPPWIAGYRAFLCEQLKTNPRFAAILNAVTQEAIASKTEALAVTQEQIEKAIREAASALRDGLGEIGRNLAAIERRLGELAGSVERYQSQFGSIDAKLADLVATHDPAAIGRSLQSVLDGAYRTMGERAFRASAMRIASFAPQPLFGRREDFLALDAFLDNRDRGTFLLTADAGMGKSRLLAFWSDSIAGPDTTVLRHFISVLYPETTTLRALHESLARQAVLQLEAEALGGGAPTEASVADRLASLLAADRPLGERLIVVIDSLDEASELIDPIARDLGRGVYIVVTARAEAGERPLILNAWRRGGEAESKSAVTERRLEGLVREAIADWLTMALRRDIPSVDPLCVTAMQASEGVPLFATFLIPDAIKALLERDDPDKAFPPAFVDYAQRELEDLERAAREGAPAELYDLFVLLTLTKGPIGGDDIERTIGLRLRPGSLHSAFERWFAIRTAVGGQTLLSFAHPRLATVFRKILPSDAVDRLKRCLFDMCEASWRPGTRRSESRYALEWLPRHLIEGDEREAASQLLADPDFISGRLDLPDAAQMTTRTVSEVLELVPTVEGREPLRQWATFWAHCETAVRAGAEREQNGAASARSVFQQMYEDTLLTRRPIDRSRSIKPYRSVPFAHPNLVRSIQDAHRGVAGVRGVLLYRGGLISWGSEGTIRFWSATGEPRPGGDLEAHGGVWGVAGVLPYGDGLLSWGSDGAIRIWSATGEPRVGGCLKAHSGHGGVRGVLPFDDGFISWGSDGAIRIWSATGEPRVGGCPKAHSGHGGVRGVLPFDDGFISWGWDGAIRFWSATGEPRPGGDPVAHGDAFGVVGVLRFVDDLISWGDDGAIRFWSASGEPRPGGDPEAHGGVRGVAGVLPYGDGLVSWGSDGAIRFWSNAGEPRPGGILEAHRGVFGVLGILPFGDCLVSWGSDGAIRFWSGTGEPRPGGDPEAHRGIRDILPFEGGLVSWGSDGAIRFWSGTGVPRLGGDAVAHDVARGGFGVLALGGGLVSWAGDGGIRFWSGTGEPRLGGDPEAHSGAYGVYGVLLFRDGLVSWGDDGAIRFWSNTGEPRQGGPTGAHDVTCGSFDILPFGEGLVSWGDDGAIRFWSASGDPRPGGDPDAHRIGVGGVLPFGDRLVSWGKDGAIRFWSASGDPRPGGDPDAHRIGVGGVLPFGDRLVSWGKDGAIRLWSATGELRPGGDPQAHRGALGVLGVLPFGDDLVSWGRDGAIRFWSATGEPCPGGSPEAHGGVRGVAGVLPFGEGLVSWGSDGAIRFWSTTGELRPGGDPQAHRGALGVLGVLPFGDGLVSWGGDGAIRLWDELGRARGVWFAPGTFGGVAVHADKNLIVMLNGRPQVLNIQSTV